jgi:hypothetical protein
MKKAFCLLLCFLPMVLCAQEEKPKNNQLTLSGALDSNDAWEVDFSYMRRFTSWMGVGAGMNFYRQYSDDITASGGSVQGQSLPQWILSDNSKKATGLQFRPFVHLNTPALFHIEDAGVNLYAEPGVLMTFLYNRNVKADYWDGSGYYSERTFDGHGGNWLSWNCRLGIALENEYGSLSIGYMASNQDMYDALRDIRIENVRLGDTLPKKHSNWGIFISIAGKL